MTWTCICKEEGIVRLESTPSYYSSPHSSHLTHIFLISYMCRCVCMCMESIYRRGEYSTQRAPFLFLFNVKFSSLFFFLKILPVYVSSILYNLKRIFSFYTFLVFDINEKCPPCCTHLKVSWMIGNFLCERGKLYTYNVWICKCDVRMTLN